MFAFARLRLPSADLAEEAVQRALVGAWRSRDSFEGRSSERTWLIGILRYKVLDLLRERSRRAGHHAIEQWGGGDEPAGIAHRAGDHTTFDADATRRAIEDALQTLPEPMRTALVLREIDGLPGKNVCEILDVSETNLWTMIHRAKSRLRELLSDHASPERDGPG